MPTQRFFRIAGAKHRSDLSGKGAEILGGRFNPVGTAAVYATSTISLATLEILVHAEYIFTLNHYIMILDVPDACMATVKQFPDDKMPKGWNKLDDLNVPQAFGIKYLFAPNGFGMLVPSVVTPEEFNLVLNPMHQDMHKVSFIEWRKLDLDKRLA